MNDFDYDDIVEFWENGGQHKESVLDELENVVVLEDF